MAKYVELFVNNQAFTLESQLDLIFDDFSMFLDEGKNLLIEEFGKDYTTYFSILIAEVKRNKNRISLEQLESKSKKLLDRKKGYTASFIAYSLDDV